MKPRIQLAVLCALLAFAAAFPDISIDQVNPPPSIVFADIHGTVDADGAKTKASEPEIKDVKEADVKSEDKLEPKPEVAKDDGKAEAEKLQDLPKVPEAQISPETIAKEKDEKKPIVLEDKEVKPLAKDEDEKPLGLKKKTARSSSISLEDQEIVGYVPFKAANAGMRLPPNQMRPLRQQAFVQQAYAQYPHHMAAQGNHERADKRKRPSDNKNKKKNGSKKRRQSSNNRKKDKKKVSANNAEPPKKPVNKKRRTPANNNNHLNANYNNHNFDNKPNYNQHPVAQTNKRKVQPAAVGNNNRNKQKQKQQQQQHLQQQHQQQQPHRQHPNTRRKPTTKRPAARRRKQTYKGRPYYNEEAY